MTSITEEMAHPFDHIECQHLEGHTPSRPRPIFEPHYLATTLSKLQLFRLQYIQSITDK